jgi:hypothetical protein
MADQPNIVLVDGAWADGSSWHAVIESLQAAGFTVTHPPHLDIDEQGFAWLTRGRLRRALRRRRRSGQGEGHVRRPAAVGGDGAW